MNKRMSVALVCLTLLGIAAVEPARALWAQAEGAAQQGARQAASTAPAADEDDDAAAKNALFNSDDWLMMRMAFDDWLSVQRIYNDEQVADIKYRVQKMIAAMNAQELRLFMMQMQAKLAILLSPEAGELRQWMGHFVSPEVIFSREELEEFDIVTMTAPQLEAALRTAEGRRASRRSAGGAFHAARQQQVAQTQAANRQRQQTAQQARSAAQASAQRTAQATPLAPARATERRAPRPRPQIIVGGAGGAAIVLSTP